MGDILLENDWKEIKQKYSKAFEICVSWGLNKGLNDRNLYDFFDENGIFVGIMPEQIKFGGCQECYEFGGFYAEIVPKDYEGIYWNTEKSGITSAKNWHNFEYIYKERKQIERIAFLKAFEILDMVVGNKTSNLKLPKTIE